MNPNGTINVTTALVPVEAGQVARQEFSGTQTTAIAETASTAVAAQAKAAVEARYLMALSRPRDMDTVRTKLLKECKRPGFAEVARYSKPVGGKPIVGPSIRFAETAMRCMTNLLPETTIVYDDATKRIVRVSVTDLEANLTYSSDLLVEKTVERSKPKDNQRVISSRMNSEGKTTYLVAATEDDLANKQAAATSKALRGNALRLIPGDIIDECMEQVIATQRDRAAQDPDAERKKLVDAFAGINVQPADLKTYLGHDLGTVSPAEIVELRSVYMAIREGEGTWQAALETKQAVTSTTKATDAPRSIADLKAKAKADKESA